MGDVLYRSMEVSVANSKSGQNPLSSSVLRFCRERSCRGLREQHNKPSYLERRSRRGCHLRLTCHYDPYYLAFDYSAPGSCLSNEGLTDVLDHGSHGNDCNGRAETQRAKTHFLIDSVSNHTYLGFFLTKLREHVMGLAVKQPTNPKLSWLQCRATQTPCNSKANTSRPQIADS